MVDEDEPGITAQWKVLEMMQKMQSTVESPMANIFACANLTGN